MSPRHYRTASRSSGSRLTAAVVGAVAGVAVGMLVAQKVGGLDGLLARLGLGSFKRSGDEDVGFDLEAMRESAGEAYEEEGDFEEDDALDDAAEAAAAALEERVLAAFLADPAFRDRAVDLRARDAAVVELTGWVNTKAERMRATAIARRVPGVLTVVNELLVGDPETTESDAAPSSP